MMRDLKHLPYKERLQELGLVSREKAERGSHISQRRAKRMVPDTFLWCPEREEGAIAIN